MTRVTGEMRRGRHRLFNEYYNNQVGPEEKTLIFPVALLTTKQIP